MKVLVTGGTGFVGREVIDSVARAGYTVRALVRPGSESKLPDVPDLETSPGDVSDPDSLAAAASGVGAAIHLVGIIRQFPDRGITFEKLHFQATLNVLNALKNAGVKRYLHMSALGARPDSSSEYHTSKARAEERVKTSGLEWTIFRPSLIFGPGDLSINTFADQVRKLPLTPVIGDGKYCLAPVSVKTVAQGFAAALDRPETSGNSLDVTGPQAYTYDELLAVIGRVLGKRPRLIHLPLGPVRLMAGLLGRFARFPLTTTQLDMLLEGSAADGTPFYQATGVKAVDFEAGLAEYLAG